jgi:predicted GNAT family acetyltransferase
MHPLDNPIWHALSTRQQDFAQANGNARKFPAEVTTLAGLPQPNDDAWNSLRSLLRENERTGLFLPEAPNLPSGLDVIMTLPLAQMVYQRGSPLSVTQEMSQLTQADVPEMVALAELTRPGPFGPRTYELGGYIGIRREGTLVAMAGERLKVPGHTEISAVCTHPDHVGHGYATALVASITKRICERGETPFLHLREDNTRALKIYERLGFAVRLVSIVALVSRTK